MPQADMSAHWLGVNIRLRQQTFGFARELMHAAAHISAPEVTAISLHIVGCLAPAVGRAHLHTMHKRHTRKVC